MEPRVNNLESMGLKVADHVAAMLAYWDKDLVCRFANAAYRDWFGKTREEMVGKMTIKQLLGPIYEKNLKYITGALAGKAQTFEREIPIPAGGVRHSLANYIPDIVDGQVQGFFVHVADITQLKLLEKELIQSNELIQYQNERLLNFSNIVSHNLRSYTTNLSSILSLFKNAETDKERDELFAHLQIISAGLTNTVSNLNQTIEAQNLSRLKLEPVNLHQIIDHTIDILKIQFTASHATVKNNVPVNATLMSNPAYMESILLNLFTNAIKYKHPDRNPVIEISAIKKNSEFELRVSDNGRGLDLEKYKHEIFGMHKTFHGNTDAKGIGLFITKQQVEAMNGWIEMTSEVGKGSVFAIHFNQQ